MLSLFCLWSLIGIPALLLGLRLLPFLARTKNFRLADRAAIATWLGLLVIANLLLALALLGPLNETIYGTVTLLLGFISLIDPNVRTQVTELARTLGRSTPTITCLAIWALFAGYIATQPVYWIDTGLYHYPAIKWLAFAGEVPGLGLLHNRFGFVSASFTIPAALDHNLLAGRTASVLNGFVYLITGTQLLIVARRWWLGTNNHADSFFACASIYVLLYYLQYGFINSASPDFPIAILIVLVAWTYLIIDWRAQSILPFALAAGAVTFKMSSLWLLAVSGSVLLLTFNIRRCLFLGLGTAIALAPLAASSFVTTGCVAYPLAQTCMDTSWSLGSDNALEMTENIKNWGRWGTMMPPDANAWNWIPQWPTQRLSNSIFTGLILLSIIATALLWNAIRTHVSIRIVSLLGNTGLMFVAASSPDLRFAIGQLALAPALLAATIGSRISMPAISRHVIAGVLLLVFFAASVTNTYRFVRAMSLAGHEVRPQLTPHWQLPPALIRTGQVIFTDQYYSDEEFKAGYMTKRSGDVYYHVPIATGLCWDMPLPCTERELRVKIRMRQPSVGISAGFLRSDR